MISVNIIPQFNKNIIQLGQLMSLYSSSSNCPGKRAVFIHFHKPRRMEPRMLNWEIEKKLKIEIEKLGLKVQNSLVIEVIESFGAVNYI